jgi:hypothetical protein
MTAFRRLQFSGRRSRRDGKQAWQRLTTAETRAYTPPRTGNLHKGPCTKSGAGLARNLTGPNFLSLQRERLLSDSKSLSLYGRLHWISKGCNPAKLRLPLFLAFSSECYTELELHLITFPLSLCTDDYFFERKQRVAPRLKTCVRERL